MYLSGFSFLVLILSNRVEIGGISENGLHMIDAAMWANVVCLSHIVAGM